jgi:hypothetical protein
MPRFRPIIYLNEVQIQTLNFLASNANSKNMLPQRIIDQCKLNVINALVARGAVILSERGYRLPAIDAKPKPQPKHRQSRPIQGQDEHTSAAAA